MEGKEEGKGMLKNQCFCTWIKNHQYLMNDQEKRYPGKRLERKLKK